MSADLPLEETSCMTGKRGVCQLYTQRMNISVVIGQFFRCQTLTEAQFAVTKWIPRCELCLFITISTWLRVNVKVLSHIFIRLGLRDLSCTVLC